MVVVTPSLTFTPKLMVRTSSVVLSGWSTGPGELDGVGAVGGDGGADDLDAAGGADERAGAGARPADRHATGGGVDRRRGERGGEGVAVHIADADDAAGGGEVGGVAGAKVVGRAVGEAFFRHRGGAGADHGGVVGAGGDGDLAGGAVEGGDVDAVDHLLALLEALHVGGAVVEV